MRYRPLTTQFGHCCTRWPPYLLHTWNCEWSIISGDTMWEGSAKSLRFRAALTSCIATFYVLSLAQPRFLSTRSCACSCAGPDMYNVQPKTPCMHLHNTFIVRCLQCFSSICAWWWTVAPAIGYIVFPSGNVTGSRFKFYV